MTRGLVTGILTVLGLIVVCSAPVSAAYTIRNGVDCSKAPDSTVCQSTSVADPLTGSNGVLHNVTRLIALFAGVAAVIVMIIAGFSYITSNGEPEAVSRAKKTIIFAAIGLVAIIAGQAIINYVISKA